MLVSEVQRSTSWLGYLSPICCWLAILWRNYRQSSLEIAMFAAEWMIFQWKIVLLSCGWHPFYCFDQFIFPLLISRCAASFMILYSVAAGVFWKYQHYVLPTSVHWLCIDSWKIMLPWCLRRAVLLILYSFLRMYYFIAISMRGTTTFIHFFFFGNVNSCIIMDRLMEVTVTIRIFSTGS